MRQIVKVSIDIPHGEGPDEGVRHDFYVREEDSKVLAAYARSFGLAVDVEPCIDYLALEEARQYLDKYLTPEARALALQQYCRSHPELQANG